MQPAYPHLPSSGPHRQHGLTLIELMVAVALGLVVTGAVLGVFITTSRNFREDEALRRMQENARLAIRELSNDLGMTDSFGYVVDLGKIDTGGLTMPSGTDCGSGVAGKWAFDLDSRLAVKSDASGAQAKAIFHCIDNTEFVADTDVLALKHTAGERISVANLGTSDNGKVFMCRNGASGKLIKYDSSSPNCAGDDAWPYIARVYFIRKQSPTADAPTLYRYQLGSGPGNSSQLKVSLGQGGIAPGVEYFHVLFGIDTDNDGVANYYQSNPTDSAVSAEIYVLIRAFNPDPTYQNRGQYHLGDVCRSYTGSAAAGSGCDELPSDHFHRRVYSTTVQLRNPRYRL